MSYQRNLSKTRLSVIAKNELKLAKNVSSILHHIVLCNKISGKKHIYIYIYTIFFFKYLF